MATFIITAKPTKDNPEKRALFYSTAIGRGRVYRQGVKTPQKGLKLFTYKLAKNAQKLCDTINQKANDNFQVEPLKSK